VSDYPTQNIELYAKDEEIERLKAEIDRLQPGSERWTLLMERYPHEPSSYSLIDELMVEAE
jgi:hypothetical protein